MHSRTLDPTIEFYRLRRKLVAHTRELRRVLADHGRRGGVVVMEVQAELEHIEEMLSMSEILGTTAEKREPIPLPARPMRALLPAAFTPECP